DNPSGVIVTGVVEGSPADTAHIDVNDVILGIGNAEVTDSVQFNSRIAEALKSPSVIFLLRDNSTGRTGFLNVKLR
ncbi:MAG TPA: PDZ domain-containing protein, partial [Rectinemataceae bacterium]|nr:PDZ domain-containing protein [Rectinemataceae bacterium]